MNFSSQSFQAHYVAVRLSTFKKRVIEIFKFKRNFSLEITSYIYKDLTIMAAALMCIDSNAKLLIVCLLKRFFKV